MPGSVGYRVRLRVQGQLEPAWWSDFFSDLELTVEDDGTSLLCGVLPDQAAVHGLLAAMRDLGLSLISIDTVADLGPRVATRGSHALDSRNS